jgi:hypothetical protein
MIDQTHSKKDLCDIILIFKLPIHNLKNKVKKQVAEEVLITLKSIDSITPNYDYYQVNNVPELINYLQSPKKENNISLKEREIAILKAKSLIHYSKGCGGTFPASDYNDLSEVVSDAEYIKKYADIPTCRMAIKTLNENNNLGYSITPELSYRVKKQLEKKQNMKANSQARFSMRRGSFTINFD